MITLFENEYANHPHLKFQIHAFENDSMFEEVMKLFPNYRLEYHTGSQASDDENIIKVIPQKITVFLTSGYSFITGISKVFDSDLRPDLNNPEKIKRTIKIFERDLEESEDNNSAVLYNFNGKKGLDWSLNYNGNICLWQNQVNDNQWNIYEDNYANVLNETFRDPITLSYIEKGTKYRESVTGEASPKAVLRQKSISLRDFSGTVLFEEEKTRLYYAIRVLQDYYHEGRCVEQEIEKLPDELKMLIKSNMMEVLELYHQASHTIVDQYKTREFNSIEWRDLLELIKLGHYELTEKQIEEALEYYNSMTNLKKYQSIKDVEYESGEHIQKRLTERLMYMKPSSKALYEKQLLEVV